MLNKIPWKRKTLPIPQAPLARAPGAGPSRPLPRGCSSPAVGTELSVARRCWVRPALSEKSAFSSCLRNGLCAYAPRRGFSRMVPSGARPPNALFARSVCSLVYRGPRLPAPSSRRDHAGQSFVDPPSCAELVGEFVFRCQVVGEGRSHARVRGAPSPRGSSRDGRCLEGRRWAPGPTRLPASPVPSVACVPPARVHVSATLAARACRAWCVPRALGRVRLPPRPTPFLGGVPTAGGIAGALLPPPRGSGGSVSRGVGLALGGGLFFGGTAVGRVRRVVGRRDPLPHVGLRRLASVSASVLSRAGWRLLGSCRGGPSVSGRLGCRGRGGTAPGERCAA